MGYKSKGKNRRGRGVVGSGTGLRPFEVRANTKKSGNKMTAKLAGRDDLKWTSGRKKEEFEATIIVHMRK